MISLVKAVVSVIVSLILYLIAMMQGIGSENPFILAIVIAAIATVVYLVWDKTEEEWGQRKKWRRFRG